MFRRISRAFKEAFWGITHHFAMAFSTANAVTITLILVVVFTTLVANISQITVNVEETIQIYVPISETVKDDQITSLKNQIQKIPGIIDVVYSDKSEELEYFISGFGEEGNIFDGYRGDDNPLPNAFIVSVGSGYSISQISGQIALIDGLEGAKYGGTTVEDFISLLSGARMVGYAFTLALTILAIFLIYNTIKITINSRSKELGIMRLCGATNSYIRAPLVLEGIFIGIMGSVIPICLIIFGYNYIYNAMGGQLVSGLLQLIPVYPFVLYVSGFALAIGVIVGLVGSYLSASRYLRLQR